MTAASLHPGPSLTERYCDPKAHGHREAREIIAAWRFFYPVSQLPMTHPWWSTTVTFCGGAL
jgi:hypothetical protein